MPLIRGSIHPFEDGELPSELIVIGYNDPATATQTYNQVLALNKDFVVTLSGLALVTVDAEGKSRVETRRRSSVCRPPRGRCVGC